MKILEERGIEYKDYGCYSEERCDYPVYGAAAARAVASGECEKGIICCGTGVGISIVANKIKGIRCVVCSEPYSAKLSRMHNNSNMLSLGARVIGTELARMIVEAWLDAEFEGGRHQPRVDMITEIENQG
ncbi:MAG: ribose 5-phosphate isomerase B [Clostridia bacterium]|nr:ribose 5-phosphate isomerase B [Clostridia bacterium]